MPMLQKQVKTQNLPKINERIRFPKVQAIDTDGTQLGVISSREAREIAEDKDLDLVLVSDKSDPPVCRIMDYGKYKYQQDKKAAKKQQGSQLKEVKMRYKIGEHDYKVRQSQAQRFLKSGDKVKATIRFRGREIQHTDLAKELLDRMAADLQDVGEVQQGPKKEGRTMMMLVAPKK
ncbi:MAG TPA: translation initiation factor IF-3 [Oscillatoriales cyanobacterium M59_W2019_021]|nr:translation initiation factor IF-3 [Oscillatoriales cyanobacterium M4454_W2019_049]HIK51060.1 translation initiation factor IF-3 [Oscillatoriales cyanobacterium M59_W2019_021]